MAAGAGVEPASSESKSGVLPVTLSRKIGARDEIRTHDTGFAIRRLGHLATRANWNSWQDSNPQPQRSKRCTLPVELQER